jgi:dTMP kinase
MSSLSPAPAKSPANPNNTPKSIQNEIFFSTEERPGTLIIVEGSDGSGKSTQLLIAKNLLESNGFFCVHSIWNSSLKMHEMQKKFKKFDINMPAAVFDTIYASDFIERYLTEMR